MRYLEKLSYLVRSKTWRERWIFDREDWSLLQTISLLIIHGTWILLLTFIMGEGNLLINCWIPALRSAWSSGHLTAQKGSFHGIINEIRVSSITRLSRIFLKTSFSNSFCCAPAFLCRSWSRSSLAVLFGADYRVVDGHAPMLKLRLVCLFWN